MKNIFILPTDKPSRLYFWRGNNTYRSQFRLRKMADFCDVESMTNEYMYITFDEEIKEGDWYYLPRTNSVYKCKEDPTELNLERRLGVAKIILTTDQELIKDGVQEIDDDFLEWIIKNPSCESVEITQMCGTCGAEGKEGDSYCERSKECNRGWAGEKYKISIPVEEQSKDDIDKFFVDMVCKPKSYAWVGVLSENTYVPEKYELKDIYSGENALPSFTTEQECQTWCDSFNKEEKAEIYARQMWGDYYDNEYDTGMELTYGEVCKNDFLAGVEYQKEQNKNLYSEEEVLEIIDSLFHQYANLFRVDAKENFLQYKKK